VKKRSLVCIAVLVCLLPCAASVRAEWEDLDGPVNENSAFASSFAVHGGTPVVAMADPDGGGNGAIHVKSHAGAAWTDVGANPISFTGQYESSSAPSIALDTDGRPCVAWQHDHNDYPETRQIFVKRYDGSDWLDLGTNPLNNDEGHAASAPCVVLDAGANAYVAWHEESETGIPQIFVKWHNGTDWELVGANPINQHSFHGARLASMALDGEGNPYVAWQEEDDSEPPVTQIFVKRFEPGEEPGEGEWTLVGTDTPLNRNSDSNAYAPRIAFNGAVPYVTWSEENPAQDLKPHVYVKRYDGELDQWTFVGGEASLNYAQDQPAYEPAIAFDDEQTPFVVWYEGTGAFEDVVFAKKLYGEAWGLVARLNMGDGLLGESPLMLFDGVDGLPYIHWLEEDDAYDWKVLVAKSTPTFVAMKSLTAAPCEDDICIRVSWETDMEPENAGFHVWRLLDAPGQEYERITGALIPAQGTESTGAAYEVLDHDVVTGQVYHYLVEDVNVESASTLNGPASAMGPLLLVPDWEVASTLHDPCAGASVPANTLALFLVPCGALLWLARATSRRNARQRA